VTLYWKKVIRNNIDVESFVIASLYYTALEAMPCYTRYIWKVKEKSKNPWLGLKDASMVLLHRRFCNEKSAAGLNLYAVMFKHRCYKAVRMFLFVRIMWSGCDCMAVWHNINSSSCGNPITFYAAITRFCHHIVHISIDKSTFKCIEVLENKSTCRYLRVNLIKSLVKVNVYLV